MPASVRVVSLEATPGQPSFADGAAGGAHVNVYVVAETDALAVERALAEVASAGWNVHATGQVSAVTSESFAPGSEGLAYYEQCQIDGVAIVMHTWRNEH